MKIKLIMSGIFLLMYNTVQADEYGCGNPENFKTEKFVQARYDECKRVAQATNDAYKACIAENTQTVQTETEETVDGRRVKTNSPSKIINDGACAPLKTASSEYDTFRTMASSKDAELGKASIAAGENKLECDKERKRRETVASQYISTEHHENSDGGNGSSLMKKCVELSGNNMRYLYGKQRKTIDWNKLVDAKEECIAITPACASADVSAKQKACDNWKRTAALCDAGAFIISQSGRDWELPEHVKPSDVKGGNPEIKCTALGIETLDYEGCAKFVQNGDIMDAAQSAIQMGQELYYKDQAMTAQMEAASSTESATAGLKALGTGIKGQQDIMNQRAAIDTGKFTALAIYYSKIPDYEEIKGICAKYQAGANGLTQNLCEAAVSQHPGFAFLMNQTAKEKMKAKLAKVGIDVTSNLVMANLMGNRLNDVNNAIAKVDAFKPIDPLAPAADNMQSTYCQQNPGDSKCLTGGLDRTFDAMDGNVISFGEGGTGTSYSNNNPYVDPTAGTKESVSSGSKNSITGVGGVISAAQQNGGLETKAGAATVSKGTAPTGGGGGGGGSGGGVGGGGGGGAPATAAQGSSPGYNGRAPKYDGGGGTLSMMGGYGINKNKGTAKDDSNPFGKLFNKDGNKSGVVNFARSPASVGNKGDNIFEMISKRYTTVSSDKRLLEYELTK